MMLLLLKSLSLIIRITCSVRWQVTLSVFNLPLQETNIRFSLQISLFQLAVKNSVKCPWIIDTGAIDHIVCSIFFLTTITSIVSKQVRLPNGNFATVTHIGTIKIFCNFDSNKCLICPFILFQSNFCQ
jgi:hypothetical protein